MSARPFGAPWLLIEICARSLVTDVSAGCPGGRGSGGNGRGRRCGVTAVVRDKVWVGVDVGKTHHWMCAVDGQGTRLLSRKVLNDEAEILCALEAVSALAPERVWAL